MNTLTLKSARKLLGKAAENASDEELQKDIEAATLLKDLFFDNYIKTKKRDSNLRPNMP